MWARGFFILLCSCGGSQTPGVGVGTAGSGIGVGVGGVGVSVNMARWTLILLKLLECLMTGCHYYLSPISRKSRSSSGTSVSPGALRTCAS
ncbi:hypothetical protein LY78DRAFT_656576 [Colletotrichum sublineola]|nr:hypothetical protein LY78DRAFT_656576 [Colletotrichum sublineola]